MSEAVRLPDDLFRFLEDLARNNNRNWFTRNRDRYEQSVKMPALSFIAAIGPGLKEVSSHFQAVPKAQGGSLFRINRDTRFSKDKSPYKANTGLHFRHETARDAHAPGFYVHLAPGEVFFGAGLWKPDGRTARAVRDRISGETGEWEAVLESLESSSLELTGDSLVQPPRGFEAEHRFISDLKRKDFLASCNLTEEEALSVGFLEKVTGLCRQAAPLMGFLCKSLDLPF